jgi:hypothetical protein
VAAVSKEAFDVVLEVGVSTGEIRSAIVSEVMVPTVEC